MTFCHEQCTCHHFQKKVAAIDSGLKTLIFDLDETLIHCLDESDLKTGIGSSGGSRNLSRPFGSMISVKYSQHETISASICIRPGAVESLRKLRNFYELVVFTASHACYANKVLELLDPHNELLTYRLYRDHCHRTEDGVYIKDLRIIANRNPKDLVLVDNSAYSYGFQPYNGIPIIPYYDDPEDRQLEELTDFLISIHGVEDVRPLLQDTFRIDHVIDSSHDLKELKASLLHSID